MSSSVRYTIGITGGSGSGKTYFLNELAKNFTQDELCLISQDNYYKDRQSQKKDENGIENFDVPEAIDWILLQNDIIKLKKGEKLLKKEYTFNNPDKKPSIIEISPKPILIIEGLFVHYFPEIASELDLKIFIDARDHLKLLRRIKRDQNERGYGLADVLYRYENHVMPVFEALIEPLKHQADLIIPNNSKPDESIRLISSALRTKITVS